MLVREFEEKLKKLEREAFQSLEEVKDIGALEELRVKFLGRKGRLTLLLRSLKDIPIEERPRLGDLSNRIKTLLEEEIERKRLRLKEEEKARALWKERIDVTLPGRPILRGKLHVLTQVMEEIIDIFVSMGFQVYEGPEVELDYYNFEALNIPPDHPAREMNDTFYFSQEVLLRTHTSPMQIRVMEKEKPPVQMISPGPVYRRDADISHSPMFHQIEGLWVDKEVTFAHLKGTLAYFVKEFFGKDIRMRFRPSYFPFTEPSAEVDISCVLCKGSGCPTCKNTGWIEILGCGMVRPEVFQVVNYDFSQWRGYAFGMGVERIAMIRHGINDIRLFFQNDLRFLDQF
jgi:phenylalanyl-tRNA synthetase alpha chain